MSKIKPSNEVVMSSQVIEGKCICCQSNDIKFLIKRLDEYSYHYCANCKLVLSSPMPTPDEISSFYDGFMGGGVEKGRNFEKKLKLIKSTTQKILSFLKNKNIMTNNPGRTKILDVGGGAGFYSKGFYDQGLIPTLIDIDKVACEYAKRTFKKKFEVINEDPIRVNLTSQFDIVFMNQLIEHYISPDSLFIKAFSWLKPGGIVIITTPNQMSKFFLFSPYFFYRYLQKTSNANFPIKSLITFLKVSWICCDPPRHVYAFNPKNLKMLLIKNGFDVERVFTEPAEFSNFSTGDIYCWRLKSLRNFISILGNIYQILGPILFPLLNFKGNWGHNLIAIGRKPF